MYLRLRKVQVSIATPPDRNVIGLRRLLCINRLIALSFPDSRI